MELTQEQRLERKIRYFEYIVFKLIEWYEEVKEADDESVEKHFSRIVVMKLLFFVAAVKNDNGEDLLDIFNDFYAMQYGPVEGEIYTAIVEKRLEYYSFPVYPVPKLEKKSPESSPILEEEGRVFAAIAALREKNNELILYSSSQLIELTHKWTCWKRAFSRARDRYAGCEFIAQEKIQEESKTTTYFK